MGTIQIDGSTPKLTIGNATAEDATILFDGNAQDFYIALDDSADDLVIGLGSTVGTTPAISINEDRDVTISDGAIDFDVASHDGTNGLKLGGTLVTTTAAELNLLDGDTSVGSSITVADADGFVVNDGGTMKTIPASDISTYAGGGITDACQWRVDTSFQGDAQPIASNWEEVDTDGYGTLGSSVTESSGIFTFPSTGYWWIQFTLVMYAEADENYHFISIDTTLDNSSYSAAADIYTSTSTDHTHYKSGTGSFLFDVTSTANCKVMFGLSTDTTASYTYGHGDINKTHVTFIKLADT